MWKLSVFVLYLNQSINDILFDEQPPHVFWLFGIVGFRDGWNR